MTQRTLRQSPAIYTIPFVPQTRNITKWGAKHQKSPLAQSEILPVSLRHSWGALTDGR